MKLNNLFGKPFMKKFPSHVIDESFFRLGGSVSGLFVVVVAVVVVVVVVFRVKILIGLPFDKKLIGFL